jgi:hypothetical protein
MGWDHLKIFLLRTTEPEELIFTWKLSDIMYIQVCTNHSPQGSGGATIEKTISILKKSSPKPAGQFQSNLVQMKRIKNCSKEGPGQGEIITEMQI